MNIRLLGHASTLAILMAAGTFVTAHAQTPSNEIEEVVVSARKTEEKLKDVPIAATVLDEAVIRDQGGVRTMEDLLANAPAVHFLDTTSPTNSEVTIRGSGTSRGTNAEAAVGLYRNGAYVGGGSVGGRTFSRLDLFDVARAEILRGTQGALYGRNAVGGAINVITQQPKFERSGDIFAQYGTNEYKQADLILNYNINDNWAVRFSGSVVDQPKGFFYNTTQDRHYDEQKTSAERLQVRYRNDRFDGNLLAEHYQGNVQSVTYQVLIPNGTSAAFPGGYIQQPYSYPRNGPMTAKQQINDVQANWSYRFDWGTLASVSNYRERRTLFTFDSDGIDAPELARVRAANPGSAATTDPNGESITTDATRSWYQDVHLSGGAGDRVNWLLGVEYVRFESNGANTTARTPAAANAFSPGTIAPVTLEVESIAGYGLVGFDLTETINLTAEGRYTSDKRTIDINRFDRRTGLPVSTVRFDVNGDNSPKNFNYTLSAGWKLQPDWLLYGKIGTAFRAGSFNTDLGDPRGSTVPLVYDDEKSRTIEVGIKGDVARGLFVSLVGYITRTNDALVQKDNGCRATNPACPVAQTNFLVNGGTAEVRGGELEVSYRAPLFGGRFRATAGVTKQAGEFVSGPDNGKRVPRIPTTGIKGDMNYVHPIGGGWSGFGNVRYASEYGGRQEINPDIPIPFTTPQRFTFAELRDHQLVDIRVGVRTATTEVAFYADNATDERYIVFETSTTNRLNAPRRVGVQLRQRF
ncbi:MAG: TonB-dependent receptor [Alphaproteobacteria bacterium]